MKLTKLRKKKKKEKKSSFNGGILNRCLYGSCGFDVKTGVEFYGVYIRLRWIFPYGLLYCILMGFLRSSSLYLRVITRVLIGASSCSTRSYNNGNKFTR